MDPNADYRPVAALAKALSIFAERKNNWGMAYWLASANSFLGGSWPQDLLIEHLEHVILAAEYEAAGVNHG